MALYVCSGAKLKCSMGSQEAGFSVIRTGRCSVYIEKKLVGTIMDYKPFVNIKPFGQCKSLANPTVAAATAASYGKLQPMPCVPNTVTPWIAGKMRVMISGEPVLLDNSKLMCMWAGLIEITNPGQDFVKEGAESLHSLKDSVKTEKKAKDIVMVACESTEEEVKEPTVKDFVEILKKIEEKQGFEAARHYAMNDIDYCKINRLAMKYVKETDDDKKEKGKDNDPNLMPSRFMLLYGADDDNLRKQGNINKHPDNFEGEPEHEISVKMLRKGLKLLRYDVEEAGPFDDAVYHAFLQHHWQHERIKLDSVYEDSNDFEKSLDRLANKYGVFTWKYLHDKYDGDVDHEDIIKELSSEYGDELLAEKGVDPQMYKPGVPYHYVWVPFSPVMDTDEELKGKDVKYQIYDRKDIELVWEGIVHTNGKIGGSLVPDFRYPLLYVNKKCMVRSMPNTKRRTHDICEAASCRRVKDSESVHYCKHHMAKDRGDAGNAKIITKPVYGSLDKAAMAAANIIIKHVSQNGRIEYGISIYGNKRDTEFCLLRTRLGDTRSIIIDYSIPFSGKYHFKASVHSHPTIFRGILDNDLSTTDYNISINMPCPMYLVTNIGSRGTLIKFTPPNPPPNFNIPTGDKFTKIKLVSEMLKSKNGVAAGQLEETPIIDAERIINEHINWKDLSPQEMLWGTNATNIEPNITFSLIQSKDEQKPIDDEIKKLINTSNIRKQLEEFNRKWGEKESTLWVENTRSKLKGKDLKDWDKLDKLRKERKPADDSLATGSGVMYLRGDEMQTAVTKKRHDLKNIISRVVIESDVRNIGDTKLFANFTNLDSIYVNTDNTKYSIDENYVLFDKNETTLIRYPTAKQGAYTIPQRVKKIESDAFFGCTGLTSIEVVISNEHLKSRDGVIFSKNNHLVRYPPGKEKDSYTIPPGVTTIESNAFNGCTKLKSIEIPYSVTSIEGGAFNGCTNLTSINVVKGKKEEKADSIFCSVNGVLFDKDKKELIRYPPGKQNKDGYEIPPGVTVIGIGAFEYCSGLTSVIIPEGVTRIDISTFERCFGLTSVTIPSSVARIEKDAFSYTNLKSIIIRRATPPEIIVVESLSPETIGDEPPSPETIVVESFKGVNVNRIDLYVPKNSVSAYSEAPGWQAFKKNIKPIKGVV